MGEWADGVVAWNKGLSHDAGHKDNPPQPNYTPKTTTRVSGLTMLHELLLVLSGHPGDLFVPFPPPPFVPNTFAIPPDFPLLHDAERRALDRLAHLGWLYKQIVDFIQTVQNGNAIGRSQQRQTNMDNGRELPRGAYILAMCTSAHESLGQYRRVIVDCEERILNKDLEAGGGCVPISHIMSLFARWELILQPLNRLMQDIAQCPADWHGCQLLDLLMERSNTGVGEVRQVMEKMARDVHAVMYKQMASWMVYGYLADPDEEFFITPYQPTPPSSPTGAGPTTAPRVSNWKNQFSLDESMIPGHIPLKLAESILFVGKAISTVRKDTTALSPTTPALTIPSSKRRKQPLSLPPSLASAHLSLLLTLSRNPTGPTSLSTATQILHLHKTIHTIRRSTAEWLFRRVLVGEHDITRYLQSFKDYFLLGRGDFAVNLIEQFAGLRRAKLAAGSSVVTERKGTSSSSSSSQPATQQAAIQIKEQELNALLIKSSIGTLCEDDPDLDKFRLRLLTPQPTSVTLGASRRASKRPLPARASLGPLPPNKNATAHLFDDLLLGGVPLRLQYAVAWPLDLFLTEDEMTKYARLWSFLIGWKRIQWRLTQLWGVLRGGWVGGRRKKGGKGKKDKGAEEDEANKSIFYESEREKEREKIVWRVRSKMMFFVDAVWGHAQVG
ncbi:gamma-tubulin complex component protein [Jimgerdemannia flammicorona]|uniref:Spindle pole body component n=1 Tax=Jimgerdemannia flammicorona TaxID=994334 RepID=A0A433Q2L8_9FUNG|nr:gamma-tubulin complex component protein [Jimgerdemannia flammicorona]